MELIHRLITAFRTWRARRNLQRWKARQESGMRHVDRIARGSMSDPRRRTIERKKK